MARRSTASFALAPLAPDDVARFLGMLERTGQQLHACLPALALGQPDEKMAATMIVMRLGNVLATDMASMACQVRVIPPASE